MYENKDISNEGKSIRGKTLQSCCEKERERGEGNQAKFSSITRLRKRKKKTYNLAKQSHYYYNGDDDC